MTTPNAAVKGSLLLEIQQKQRRRLLLTLAANATGIILVAIVAVWQGPGGLSLGRALQALGSGLVGRAEPGDTASLLVWSIRVPRAVLAVVIGGGLAASGAALQNVLRNPLADPFTLGVSSGAAFGASVALAFPAITGAVRVFNTTVAALIGAGLALAAVYALSAQRGFRPVDMVLSGVVVSSILSALISLVKTLSGDNLTSVVFWLMGGLSGRGWAHVWTVAPAVIAATIIIIRYGDVLDIMSLGSEEAAHLGVDVAKARRVLLCASAVIAGVSTASTGIIGFVGLMVPHLCRRASSASGKWLVVLSASGGSLLLLSADTIVRLHSAVRELPVGVFTSVLGGFYFIMLFLTGTGREAWLE